jgi:hypothetical protein
MLGIPSLAGGVSESSRIGCGSESSRLDLRNSIEAMVIAFSQARSGSIICRCIDALSNWKTYIIRNICS